MCGIGETARAIRAADAARKGWAKPFDEISIRDSSCAQQDAVGELMIWRT